MNHDLTTTAVMNGENQNQPLADGENHPANSPTFSPRFDIWEGESEVIAYGE